MNTNNMQFMFKEKAVAIPSEQKGAKGHENAVTSLCRKLNSEQMSRLIRISPTGSVGEK